MRISDWSSDVCSSDLSMLLGTPLEPDLSGHILLVEEVSEYLYAFDRAFFHVASCLAPRGLAGLRLGRVSDVPENDRPFGAEDEAIARDWCTRTGIPRYEERPVGKGGVGTSRNRG